MGLQLVAGCPGIEEAGSEGREHSGENRVLGGLGILGLQVGITRGWE